MSFNLSSQNFAIPYTFDSSQLKRGYTHNIAFQAGTTAYMIILLAYLLGRGIRSGNVPMLVISILSTVIIAAYFILILFNFFIILNWILVGILAGIAILILITYMFRKVNLALMILCGIFACILFQGTGKDLNQIQIIDSNQVDIIYTK